MSEIYFTSDLHFFHKRILEYNAHSRPFTTVEEMHEAIISNWNNTVSKNDIVYILGDVSFGPAFKTAELLNRLNGKKHLILGNHDSSYLKSDSFVSSFMSINHYAELKYNKQFICMFHFPIESWNRKHYGSLHIHGHLHSINGELTQRRMDIGLDSNNLLPYHIDNVIEILTAVPVPINNHHNREM